VYSWDTDVTDILDTSLFQWKRNSDSAYTFIGDGNSNTFYLKSTYPLGAIYIDGTQLDNEDYTFDVTTGTLVLNITPENEAIVKIIDTNDLGWNNDHIGMKSITITHDDVYENARFNCEVDLP
jgi:hypothetical protein